MRIDWIKIDSMRFLITIGLLAFLISQLGAGTGFRKYAGEFMAIDVSPRAQALGGAFTAMVNDVTAGFYNPAALVQIQSTQAAFMHTWQFVNLVNYDFLGFTKPISPDKAFGIGLIRLGIDNIKDTRQARILNGDEWRLDLSKVKNFNASDYVLFLSMGQRFRDNWSWGLNFKLVRRNLAEHHANGLGFDAGALLNLNSRWKIGIMIRNITSTLVAWDTGEKELVRPTLRLGTSYFLSIPALKGYFIPDLDFILHSENLPEINDNNTSLLGNGILQGAAGGEFVFREVLFLRGGIDELRRINFGLGVKIPHIHVDYSFTSYDQELGNSHRIGVIVDFEK